MKPTVTVLRHIYDDPFTYVEVKATYPVSSSQSISFTAYGFAKRDCAHDQPNEKIGYEIAYTRAMKKIREKFMRYKLAKVKLN